MLVTRLALMNLDCLSRRSVLAGFSIGGGKNFATFQRPSVSDNRKSLHSHAVKQYELFYFDVNFFSRSYQMVLPRIQTYELVIVSWP